MDFGTRMTKAQEMRRVMIRGLKMCEVSKAEFVERFGVAMHSVFAEEIASLIAAGLLTDEDDRIALTDKGRIYGTNVYERFYTVDDLRPPASGEIQYGISHLLTAS
jgi:oxygen-independent coproporphyrinogen-3 oxidase